MLRRLTFTAAFALLVGAAVIGCTESAVTSDLDIAGAKPGNFEDGWLGNGMPSGAHFNLNLIGTNDKTAEMDDNSGRRIFVKLWGNTKILLTEGEFAVLDANGTDADGAHFQLPAPDGDCDGVTDYAVFVRELGKPNRTAQIESCYTDVTTHESYCASDIEGGVIQVELSREGGQPKTQNVTKQLLYVDYCKVWGDDDDLSGSLEPDECDRWAIIPLFGDEAEEFFWSYDNQGMRLAQLRFYDVSYDTGYVHDDFFDEAECALLDPTNSYPGQ
jgi:hypothetical protein